MKSLVQVPGGGGVAPDGAGTALGLWDPAVSTPHPEKKRKREKKKSERQSVFSLSHIGLQPPALPQDRGPREPSRAAGPGGAAVPCHPQGRGWQRGCAEALGENTSGRAVSPGCCSSRRTAGPGQGSCCEFTGAALSHSLEE